MQIARRELELIRETQRLTMSAGQQTQIAGRENSRNFTKVSIKTITDLFNQFDGNSDYEVWEKQVRLIKATYHLPDEHVKISVGMRLKGRVLEWLHSKPQHIELPADTLLNEMREMFDHRPSKVLLRQQFEKRIRNREETFHQYAHEKVILAN